MTTPWGVKFHQDILATLDTRDFIEVGSNEHLDWQRIPVFGERRGLEVTLRMVRHRHNSEIDRCVYILSINEKTHPFGCSYFDLSINNSTGEVSEALFVNGISFRQVFGSLLAEFNDAHHGCERFCWGRMILAL